MARIGPRRGGAFRAGAAQVTQIAQQMRRQLLLNPAAARAEHDWFNPLDFPANGEKLESQSFILHEQTIDLTLQVLDAPAFCVISRFMAQPGAIVRAFVFHIRGRSFEPVVWFIVDCRHTPLRGAILQA